VGPPDYARDQARVSLEILIDQNIDKGRSMRDADQAAKFIGEDGVE
jgi:hypothetical protein